MAKTCIAVDSGKYMTKAVMAVNKDDPSKDKVLSFRTSVSEHSKDIGITSDTASVEFNGTTYDVGVLQAKMTDSSSSKNTETHKICIYTAIARLLGKDDMNVSVAIGCPLDIFINVNEKEKYIKNILPLNEVIEIKINGIVIKFRIIEANVYPESAGLIYLNIKDYKEKIINVIDIGGLNVNGCQFDKLRPVVTSIFTKNLGGNTLVEDLRDYLATTEGVDRSTLWDNELEHWIKNNEIPNFEEGRKIIAEKKLKKANDILEACKDKQWNLKFSTTVFTGGTSELLKEEVKKVFGVTDAAFYKDPIFSNAKGFLKMIRR